MKSRKLSALTIIAASMLTCGIGIARAQQLSVPERVAALKASLAASKAMLKEYEWVQTTVVSLDGEEKSRKQERCYYGADGALQKVLISQSPPPAKKPGLRGRIMEKKMAELKDYMQNAVALVKTYVPPDPGMIQAAKDAGNATIQVLDPGKRARLNFQGYEKPGDNLGVEVDLANNRALGLKVSTYIDDAKDAVTLDVSMSRLNNGTTYAATSMLNAKAKNLTVRVENSGYRKTN